MRAYQLPKGGAGVDALQEVERPEPKAAHRQVLVKVKACSLNFRDFAIARGSYRMGVRDNLIPLSDGAGEVVEIGSGVSRVKVGDRVAGNFFQRWTGGEPSADAHKSALGGGIDGMLAEYVVLEEDGVVKIPHASVAGGGRDAAVRGRDRVARDVRARQAQGRRHRALARHRRRVDLRAAIRQGDGHPRHHHFVERREAQARRRHSAPRMASTTRRRRNGTRRRSTSPAAPASIMWSKSAGPRP